MSNSVIVSLANKSKKVLMDIEIPSDATVESISKQLLPILRLNGFSEYSHQGKIEIFVENKNGTFRKTFTEKTVKENMIYDGDIIIAVMI